jgi:hypothetical protein
MGHGRRHILWFGVTAHPTAERIANQVTEACGWEQVPRYLIRDRDGAYDEVFIRRLRSIGIRDRPTSPRSPWQNGYAERLIGSLRREWLDHGYCIQRAPPPSPAALLHEILQWGPHASIPGERCAGLARRRSRRAILCRPILGGLHTNMAGFNLRQAQVRGIVLSARTRSNRAQRGGGWPRDEMVPAFAGTPTIQGIKLNGLTASARGRATAASLQSLAGRLLSSEKRSPPVHAGAI